MSKKAEKLAKSDDIAGSLGANRRTGSAPGAVAPRSAPARLAGLVRSQDVATIPLDKILPDPDQPRKDFDEASLERMGETLAKQGQLMPIRVRWSEPSGKYVIIDGERRWRGAMKAGLAGLQAVIDDKDPDPGVILEMQLIANCVREDLSYLDQARSFKRLMESKGWSGNELARELGISQPSVVYALAVLTGVGEDVQAHVEAGSIAPRTAYELSKIKDPALQQEVAAQVVDEGLTREQTRERVKRAASPVAPEKVGKGGSGPKSLKPWSHRIPGFGKVTIEFVKNADPMAGVSALDQVKDKYLRDHAEAS